VCYGDAARNFSIDYLNLNRVGIIDINNSGPCKYYLKSQITYASGIWTRGNNSGILDNSTIDLEKTVQISEDVVLLTIVNCKCLSIPDGVKVVILTGNNL
jgi:hypothetical protein